MVHVGHQTPLAAEGQGPVHVTVLLACCGLPCCLIWLAAGLTGAAYAASGHASSRTTSIWLALTLHLACVLACTRLKKKHVLRWGKPLDSQLPSPNHQPPASLQSNVELRGAADGFRADFIYGYSSTNLASRCPASNLQPSLGAHPATSYCL
jgi:hypothetical protein